MQTTHRTWRPSPDEEYDLIISIGYMLADATRTAAEQNPDIKFAIVDDATIDLPNVTC